MALRSLLIGLLLGLFGCGLALADTAPFDLAGPRLKVTVTHGGATLPISQVPNLSPGDQLAIKADLPAGQSVHYLLVAAFLRGATNPPPQSWFYRAETWNSKGRDGLSITVPAEAQQVVVFLAPQTGGDFKTLVGAVRGRPGVFVRASQDLNQAALDRSRLDVFLDAIHKRDPADPDRLKRVSPLLARSLTIKLNADCLQKMPELQAACLMQGQDSLVLNDGHSTSIVQALTSGNLSDLTMQLSYSPQARFGYYSSYVAAVTDIARIMDLLHTAQYTYIPALARSRDDQMALLLNTAPSFHNPLSVLVTALPAVEPPQAPPLQPVDSKETYCAARTDLVLPVEGAPLVYSTGYAHDMALRVKTADGRTLELPVTADAEKGGLVADTSGVKPHDLGETVDGVLHGRWGFEPFDGPSFRLQTARIEHWRLSPDDQQGLVVGRNDIVHLDGQGSACVESVALRQGDGSAQNLEWKATDPDSLLVTTPLADAQPGEITLLVKQYGMKEPDAVPLQAFAQAGHIESFTFHAGDLSGVLKGARLDEVARVALGGIAFTPGDLTSAGGGDELSLTTADAPGVAKLKAGQSMTAKVALKDGRTVNVKFKVAAPRPHVTLIDKSVQPAAQRAPVAIQLTDPIELPQNAQLTFSVRAQAPTSFSGRESIEVATTDGSASTTLTQASGLTLEDSHVALATLDTGKAFNASTFGALQFRLVQEGGAGDWHPLAVLVRLPELRELKCGGGPEQPCKLSGTSLFLIDSVSSDPAFEHAVKVPEGFPGQTLSVPHPRGGRLYLKLRDNPQVINQAVFPTGGRSPSAAPGNASKPDA
jgi:hypothetical protein